MANGTVLVKEGGLTAAWNTEWTGAVTQVAVASNPTNGHLIGVLNFGLVLVQEGSLTAGWNAE